MPRVHFVKRANKDNPIAKKGESYYWWKFRYGGKHLSKTPPKASQLTQSEFLGTVYNILEELTEAKPETKDELQSMLEDICSRIEELGSECDEKLNNMPDGLQDGNTGSLLRERIDAMESWRSELEEIANECEDEEANLDDLLSRVHGTDVCVS